MAGTKDAACFEFGQDENISLLELSRSLHRLGLIVLFAGILFVAYLVISFLDPVSVLAISDARSMALSTVDYALWALIALLVIYLSVKVVGLAKPIRLIAQTTGADISHLMRFVGDLTSLAGTCFWGLLAICILMAVSLVLLILVF